MKITFFVVLAVVAVALNVHAAEKVIEFLQPSIEEKDGFVEIRIEGARYTTVNRGSKTAPPQLPFMDIQFDVPKETKPDEISVKILSETEIKLAKKIIPSKAWRVIGEKESTTLPNEIYNSVGHYPAEFFRIFPIMEVCGKRVTTVRVFPVQYYPKKDRIIFHKTVLINYPDAKIVTMVTEPQPHLLIISSQEIIESGALSNYISHRQGEKYTIHLKTVEWITQNKQGRDSQEKIRTYLQEYEFSFTGEYVLFVGDNSVIPVRMIPGSIPLGLNYPNEMYYFCLDGSWDENENNIFGEHEDNVDLTPNIHFGRINIDSSEKAENMLSLIISAEDSYQNQFLGLGCSDYNNAGRIGIEKALKYIPSKLTVYTIFEDETPKYAQEVISRINADMVGYVAHIDHGKTGQISTGGDCIEIPDVMGLTNMEPVFINTASCFSANISAEKCIAESFFDSGSAIVYVGQSSFGLHPFSDQELVPNLFKIWFGSPNLTLGKAYTQHIQLFLPEPNYAERFCTLERMPLFDPTMKLRRDFCKGDFDNDGDIDDSDLAVFAADFDRTDCTDDCEGDFDNDGDVDGSDLAVFIANFGRTDCN